MIISRVFAILFRMKRIYRTSVAGYPRIGSARELKFASEHFFAGKTTEKELLQTAAEIRRKNWLTQKDAGIDFIPCNDFSFYDGMLDTCFMTGAIPAEYKNLCLSKTDTYFAMARGYQGESGDVRATATMNFAILRLTESDLTLLKELRTFR